MRFVSEKRAKRKKKRFIKDNSLHIHILYLTILFTPIELIGYAKTFLSTWTIILTKKCLNLNDARTSEEKTFC